MNEFLRFYFSLWFISIPLTIFLLYKVVTEILDLILNTGKINELLKHSDFLEYELLKNAHQGNKIKKSEIDTSHIEFLEKKAQECIVPISLYQKAKRLFNIFKV